MNLIGLRIRKVSVGSGNQSQVRNRRFESELAEIFFAVRNEVRQAFARRRLKPPRRKRGERRRKPRKRTPDAGERQSGAAAKAAEDPTRKRAKKTCLLMYSSPLSPTRAQTQLLCARVY